MDLDLAYSYVVIMEEQLLVFTIFVVVTLLLYICLPVDIFNTLIAS